MTSIQPIHLHGIIFFIYHAMLLWRGYLMLLCLCSNLACTRLHEVSRFGLRCYLTLRTKTSFSPTAAPFVSVRRRQQQRHRLKMDDSSLVSLSGLLLGSASFPFLSVCWLSSVDGPRCGCDPVNGCVGSLLVFFFTRPASSVSETAGVSGHSGAW